MGPISDSDDATAVAINLVQAIIHESMPCIQEAGAEALRSPRARTVQRLRT